jgi:hypothetical protein
VYDCYKDGEWRVDFRMPLSYAEAEQWGALLAKLGSVQLNEDRDKMIWELRLDL